MANGTKESISQFLPRNFSDEVQRQLIVPLKPKWGAKEFPIKRFLTCGSCGASIVGESKTKTLKNGKQLAFVYYHCSRQVDYACKEPWIREEKLVKELTDFCSILFSVTGNLEPGLVDAIDKYSKMLQTVNKKFTNNKVFSSYTKNMY